MSLIQRVHDFLGTNREDAQEQTRTPSPIATHLYWCESCLITYIDETMYVCPECDSTVERIPSGRELGHV